MPGSWSEVLDSLAAQIELQEKCLLLGHPAPPDLEIEPPDHPLAADERVRAAELFGRCEGLLDAATDRAVAARPPARSPYRTRRTA